MTPTPKSNAKAEAATDDTPGAVKRRRILLWVVAVSASVVFLILGIMWSEPPPPAQIILATGGKTGAYYSYGNEYARLMRDRGLMTTVKSTAGSVENVRLLLEGLVDVAFVQGGVSPSPEQTVAEILGTGDDQRRAGDVLASVAALYFEPLWVFYRGSDSVVLLNQVKGKRVAVGAQGSGTLALANVLLSRNGVDETNTELQYLNSAKAAAALIEGKVDVAMMVTSHESQDVIKLAQAPNVRLMSFRRHVAYVKSVPYLGRVDISQGIVDLQQNIPPSDIVLLAPAATLVCRRDLHPTVVDQLLRAAKMLHRKGSLLHPAGQFPNDDLVDLPLHEAAETYFQSGTPGLTGLVPFWIVRLVFKLQILALPLITLLLPFFKLGGVLWHFRITHLIRRHYTALRRIETQYEEAADTATLREAVDSLKSLRDQMASISQGVPGAYQNQIYHWRLHVSMVIEEFEQRLKEAQQ